MELVRWNPLQEAMTLKQAMDRMLDASYLQPFWTSDDGADTIVPVVDMYETGNEVVVKATMTGVEEKDLDINITGDTLTIKGETKSEKEEKQENYYYQERRYGTFSRSISLPAGLETDKAEAVLESGVLTLTLPKAESVKPKAVKVKTKTTGDAKKEAKS
jgi:HSP20 family protein